MSFKPSVIDTSHIALPSDLEDLVEVLARNTHEVRARQRLLEGWTYGRHRDDKNKKHPGLVSYEQLPEKEKDYDRNTTVEILKVIQQIGYQLLRSEDAIRTTGIGTATGTPLQFLDQMGSLNLSSLLAFWNARTPGEWTNMLEIYRYLGQRVLK